MNNVMRRKEPFKTLRYIHISSRLPFLNSNKLLIIFSCLIIIINFQRIQIIVFLSRHWHSFEATDCERGMCATF